MAHIHVARGISSSGIVNPPIPTLQFSFFWLYQQAFLDARLVVVVVVFSLPIFDSHYRFLALARAAISVLCMFLCFLALNTIEREYSFNLFTLWRDRCASNFPSLLRPFDLSLYKTCKNTRREWVSGGAVAIKVKMSSLFAPGLIFNCLPDQGQNVNTDRAHPSLIG